MCFKTNISICNMPNDYKQDGKSLEQQVLSLCCGNRTYKVNSLSATRACPAKHKNERMDDYTHYFVSITLLN